jgi:carbamoyl-phosphate synthase large subunit
MKRRRVLVTGTGGRSVGAGVLHALTRTGDAAIAKRWEVVAASADPYSFGLYLTERRAILPLASAPDYLDRLSEVIDRHAIVAVLPGTEVEMARLAQAGGKLGPARIVANRPELMPLMLDKRELAARLGEMGVATPATAPATTLESFVRQHGLPVILKPASGTGGSRGVKIITRKHQVDSAVREQGENLRGLIVQEYVGSQDSEFTVGVLTDATGALIDSIVLQRKLLGLSLLDSVRHEGREYAISTGYSQGFIVKNERVQSACERLALLLGSRGPLNVQLRIDGDRIVVFEIHPRFSGTTPIRADAGFNEPDLLLRNFLDGETFGRIGYRTNLVAIRAFEHVLVPFAEFEKLGGEVPDAS